MSVPSDQIFFTSEELAAIQRADVEAAAGEGRMHRSAKAMFAHLGTLGAANSDADL